MNTETLEITKTDVDQEQEPRIVVFNDNHNSFDHVISCLVQYCKHSIAQAEQCAWIIHTKGKYAVKHGSLEELLPINEALGANDLTTEIQY
jgi:ATP-dependent Clp protease adaptor protein ClpS